MIKQAEGIYDHESRALNVDKCWKQKNRYVGRSWNALIVAKVVSFLKDDRSKSSGKSIRVYDYEPFRQNLLSQLAWGLMERGAQLHCLPLGGGGIRKDESNCLCQSFRSPPMMKNVFKRISSITMLSELTMGTNDMRGMFQRAVCPTMRFFKVVVVAVAARTGRVSD